MASKTIQVKSLRAAPFEVVYKEMIAEFGIIFEKKVINVVDQQGNELDDDYVLTEAERNKALDDLRVKLDGNLIGPYSEERHKIVDRFIKSFSSHESPGVDYNLCLAFFDCLLDKSFTRFDQSGGKGHPFSNFDLSQLLPVISKRSPNLQSLGLSFAAPELVTTSMPILPTSLNTFKMMTSLSLSCDWDAPIEIDFLSFFKWLGESCPKLICFKLSDRVVVRFKLECMLSLVLGKKRDLLPQQLVDKLKDYHSTGATHLQFTPESVTPICSTLQQLKLGMMLSPESTAFVFRHFSNLQKFSSSDSVGEALLLLHEQRQQYITPEPPSERSSLELGHIKWTLNAPFRGQLKFISLGDINCKSHKEMDSIAALCPLLKEVTFVHPGQPTWSDDYLSTDQLRSLLSSGSFWSNVENLILYSVKTKYRLVVLDCLGHQLRKLKLKSCEGVDPAVELLSMKRLEALTIRYCTLTPITTAAALVKHVPREILADCANQFLPQLRELETIGICLGYWSRLFDCRRPSLTKLRLNCSHLGLPSMTRLNWSDAPDLWPNLTEVRFLNGEGCATLNTLKSIAPHLNGFQNLRDLVIAKRLALAEDVSMSSLEVLTQTGHPLPSVGVMSFRICRCYSCAECLYHQQEEERKQNLDY